MWLAVRLDFFVWLVIYVHILWVWEEKTSLSHQWVATLQITISSNGSLTHNAPVTTVADDYCNIYHNFYVNKAQNSCELSARQFIWNIKSYLFFKKSDKIWKCCLLQILGGYSRKKYHQGVKCNFELNSLGWGINVVFCPLKVPFN